MHPHGVEDASVALVGIETVVQELAETVRRFKESQSEAAIASNPSTNALESPRIKFAAVRTSPIREISGFKIEKEEASSAGVRCIKATLG